MRCEDLRSELSAWIDGQLSADDRAHVTAHLRTCPACSAHVRELQDISSLLRTLPAHRAPVSVTAAAIRQARAMKLRGIERQGAAPRWRLPLAWPIPALGIGLAGLAAAIALVVSAGRQDGTLAPGQSADSLQSGARSAATKMPDAAGYHLSSAPDSVTGTIPIIRGYDFRGGQNHRDIGTFNARERYAWDRGVWRREQRSGRDGWWWDVAGAGYWYDKPAGGPPAVVSDIRFAADPTTTAGTPVPPPKTTGPPQLPQRSE